MKLSTWSQLSTKLDYAGAIKREQTACAPYTVTRNKYFANIDHTPSLLLLIVFTLTAYNFNSALLYCLLCESN